MRKVLTVIGGDRRMLFSGGYFLNRGYAVTHCLFDSDYLPDTVEGNIILPLPAFRNESLFAPFSRTAVDGKTLVSLIKSGSAVFGGLLTENFIGLCKSRGICATDYYKNEAFLLENADLTAQAAVMLLEEEKIKIGGEKIFILGFGRCGRALCKRLSENGGYVTAVTGKAGADGYDFIPFEELPSQIGAASLVINTVPSLVLGEAELNKMKKNSVAVEIASKPFGIDFAAAAERNIRVIRAPSLPGRFLPEKAGEAIAKTIESLLGDG
jgi:dipicolinate synthase subunit A